MASMPATPTAASRVELVLAQLDTLPSLAPVAARIVTLTADPRTQAREVTELIRSDPSLTARVLSVLGRARHGLRPEAVTLENAVTLLGFETIRQLALAVKVMEVFGPSAGAAEGEGLDRREFWKHCLAVACAARRVAMKVRSALGPEEAFVCGLLHDMGKLALETALPKSYRRVVRQCDSSREDIAEVERLVIGVDHAMAGRRLADRWGLPQRIVDCIWLHHQEPSALPESVRSGGHVQVVQLADALAREQRIGYSGNYRMAHDSRRLAGPLGLSEEDRGDIVAGLVEEIEERAAWIGAEDITSREVYVRALLASTEEISRANTALSEQNRRLQRKAEYFAALGWLSQAVSPRASVGEVCAAAAEALRRALGVETVCVFVGGPEGRWTEAGLSGGRWQGEILAGDLAPGEDSPECAAAVGLALSGTWIHPAGAGFGRIVDRFRGRLGEGPSWLLPIVCQRRWSGGALFAAPPAVVDALRQDSAEVEAISAAAGLALAQTLAQASARAMGDELAQVHRQWAAMQAELLRTRTLESIVAMAAGAAHELNNPLAVISGRAQMLRSQVADEEQRRTLETIARQASECSGIVTELMEFAEPGPASPESVGLADALGQVEREARAAGLLEGRTLRVELPPDMPPVWFDRGLLVRMFRELLDNAVEATGPGGVLTIKASRDLAEENAVVVVSDTGRGMAEDVLGRALDPFFSHRPAGRGRGLGLARVSRWLSDGRGRIAIESEEGRGTRVELRLPLHAAGAG
jgi:putative nucleotidyltransferase with HDIG domain